MPGRWTPADRRAQHTTCRSRAVGAMSAYLSRLLSSRSYQSLRTLGQEIAQHFPTPLNQAMRRATSSRRHADRRHLVRELGFYYIGPIDVTTSTTCCGAGATSRRRRPGAGPCRDAEGQGLRSGGSVGGQVPRGGEVRRGDRQAGQAGAPAPSYTQSLPGADPGGGGRRSVVAITAAMPSGTGRSICSPSGSPSAASSRDRRAACGDVRGGPGGGRDEAVCGDLLDVLQRPTTRWCMTWRSRPAGALRARPAGLVGGGRGDPCRGLRHRLSGVPAGLRADGVGRRVELMHMVATAAAIDDRRARCAIRRGDATGLARPARGEVLALGKAG